MKTISLFLLSSVTYGALASQDTIDLPKDNDVAYNERLDELLKVQHELQAALNSLLQSKVLNEIDYREEEEKPTAHGEDIESDSKVREAEEAVEFKEAQETTEVETRESDIESEEATETEVEKRETQETDMESEVEKRETQESDMDSEETTETEVEKRETQESDMESEVEQRETQTDMESEETTETEVEKRETQESDMESEVEQRETQESDMESEVEKRETQESDMESEVEKRETQESDLESGDENVQIETTMKPKEAVFVVNTQDAVEVFVEPESPTETLISKIQPVKTTKPMGSLKDIKPSDLPRTYKNMSYDGLSYQAFKPSRLVFPRFTTEQEDSEPSYYTSPPVALRKISKQSIEDSTLNQAIKPIFRAGASQSKYRRSKLGQYMDAVAYWKTLREQVRIQPPLSVYVDIQTTENATESLTRMHLRTTSQNKADLIQLALDKGSKMNGMGDFEDLKESEAAAKAAIAYFADSRGDKVTIRNYYDHLKNHTVHTNLNLVVGPILGRGGNAIVLQATAADRFTQTILGAQRVAIKVLYVERERTEELTENDYLNLFQEEIQVEALPANYAARSGRFDSSAALNEKGGFLTFKMSSELSPYLDGEIVLCGGYVFYSKVLIFEKMLIDVRSLILPCPPISRKYTAHCAILSMDERIYIAREMLLRVAALHSMGLVHYDIKPANFLISNKGKVVLSDFGFAAPAGSPIECGANCTPKYQDPENAACALKRQVLGREFEYDAWSLGLSMYYVITNGEYPYSISRKRNILKGLADFLEQDPQEVAFLKGEAIWQTMERLGVPTYLSQSITLLLQTHREDRATPLKLLSMYSEYVNGN